MPDGAGFTEQDLIDAVHPEDQLAFTSALLDAVDGGRPFQLLHRLGTGDAAQWVDSRGTRVAGEDGVSCRVAAVTVAVEVDAGGAPSR
ncbi:PAS domain-containing protein [Brevundimonas sp. GCM10030266]|uniref:PAS domain-containing protein n=1 Tax=Brevundimonas sp. GCM10030266 TaxID=3273386 RepID=UPI003612D151